MYIPFLPYRPGTLLALLLLISGAFAQTRSIAEIAGIEQKRAAGRLQQPASEASPWFDASYYKLDLTLTVQPNHLSGIVTVAGRTRQNNVTALTLDLAHSLTIDSVIINGSPAFFVQRTNSFEVTLDRTYHTNEIITLHVHYNGTPVPSGFGSFIYMQHNGTPWFYSLSEPHGASDWWPCRNSVSDKADSADIIITCDSLFIVGSQGRLVSRTDAGNGRKRTHWSERYPVAPYLISITGTDYTQFSHYYKYSPTDSLEILNYVLPEHAAAAKEGLAKTPGMLAVFEPMFGPYPFRKEKYGHCEFTGGGMEHQTMTSLGRWDEGVVSHELAHQWFGDMITCRTWSDLWLNEGFAEYATGLYYERQYGTTQYWNYMTPLLRAAEGATGILGAPDTTQPNALFTFNRTYAKGAVVLHMLRHLLGDTIFFRSLRSYATDPALQYSTAVTMDFWTHCEMVSGRDLGPFFAQWVYGEGVPTYETSWHWHSETTPPSLSIIIKQPAGRTTPAVYSMPLDIRIATMERETTITVLNDAAEQTVTIPLKSKPLTVTLDPEGWVLKKVVDGNAQLPTEFALLQNYPNPFNAGTTIRYMLPSRSEVTLRIYDILGREVATLVRGRQEAGTYEVKWVPEGVGSGVFIYQLTTNNKLNMNKMVFL